MKWHHRTLGTHTHCRVFMNGALCGNLCFRNEEFEQIREQTLQRGGGLIQFVSDEAPHGRTLVPTTNQFPAVE